MKAKCKICDKEIEVVKTNGWMYQKGAICSDFSWLCDECQKEQYFLGMESEKEKKKE